MRGKLALVDLAGSERAAETNNGGQKLRDGANINRSLLALANCINALGKQHKKGLAYVPYRNSKLTRILKDGLSGNSQTVMVATISPADSQYHHTVKKGFMDLLHSQQEPNPYESVSPSIELGESGVPVYSTQCSYAPSQGEDTIEDSRSRRSKWSPKEDLVLIGVWLNTSKDPIVGNEQKADAFWKRIAAYVASSQKGDCVKKREASHCKQMWGKINDIVCKYVGCYEAETTQKASGQNDNDVMKLANAIYFNDHKKKFTLEHAWRELRHDQKWCASSYIKETGMAKRRKLDDGSAHSSSSNPLSHGLDEAMARPPGVKASKAKAKRNATNTSTVEKEGATMLEIQSLWEIKQTDFALKEKLSKHKLLDSLISKTEPLDEIEMALKKKLINDMLSS